MKIEDLQTYKKELIEDIEKLEEITEPYTKKYFVELTGIMALILAGLLTLIVLLVSALLNPFLKDYAHQIISTYFWLAIIIFAAILFINWQIKKISAKCYKV